MPKELDDERRAQCKGEVSCAENKHEGSKAEPKSLDDDEVSATPILDRVLELMLSSNMERDFEEFAARNVELFMAEARTGGAEEPREYRLAHTEIYQKYLQVFEKKVADFIEGEGASVEDFFEQCRTVVERNDEYDSRKYFIEALLATTEFQVFYNLMIWEAKSRIIAEEGERRASPCCDHKK